MSNNQQQLIKQYFQSLVDEFIKNPLHNQYITIIFVSSFSDGSLELGNTKRTAGGGATWQVYPDGRRVPGSERKNPYKYTVSFLNHYEDEEKWHATVVHEFTHLYFFSKSDENHEHDDNFFSKVDYFEDWLDKKWNLTPRKYKGWDWNQHIDPNRQKWREKQYPSSESGELSHLTDLIQKAKSLEELEKNWKTIINHDLYTTNKKTYKTFRDNSDGVTKENKLNNKEWLDREYDINKSKLKPNVSNCEMCQKSINLTTYYSKSNRALCKECYDTEREREREQNRLLLPNQSTANLELSLVLA